MNIASLVQLPKPFCKPHFHVRRVGPRGVGGFRPDQVAAAYGLSPRATARTPVIGILELGGGYRDADNNQAFASMQQAVPSMQNVSVMGASNSPGDDADGEVALDIQAAAGVCQAMTGGSSKVVMAWAPNSGGAAFAAGIDALVAAGVDSISISWGQNERGWSPQDRKLVGDAIDRAVAAGIPVFAASGDNNSGDGGSGNNVDFPAAYPGSIGCGGTNLIVNHDGSLTERVWNDGQGDGTGGGFSVYYPRPAWQAGSNAARGVPDMAGPGDPQTGWRIVLNGNVQIIGGTSAVAPMWAGILAALKAAGCDGRKLIQRLYVSPAALRDITVGNNGGFQAGPGWDPCTGLGTPNGPTLVSLLLGSTPTPPPPTGQITGTLTLLISLPAGTFPLGGYGTISLPVAVPAGAYTLAITTTSPATVFRTNLTVTATIPSGSQTLPGVGSLTLSASVPVGSYEALLTPVAAPPPPPPPQPAPTGPTARQVWDAVRGAVDSYALRFGWFGGYIRGCEPDVARALAKLYNMPNFESGEPVMFTGTQNSKARSLIGQVNNELALGTIDWAKVIQLILQLIQVLTGGAPVAAPTGVVAHSVLTPYTAATLRAHLSALDAELATPGFNWANLGNILKTVATIINILGPVLTGIGGAVPTP